MTWASSLSDTPQVLIASSCHQQVCDLIKLVYLFNAENPWRYFQDGVPITSSVERGQKKRDLKLKKIHTRKWKKINVQKNQTYKDTEAMSLLCSFDRGCLIASAISWMSTNDTGFESSFLSKKLQWTKLCSFRTNQSQSLSYWAQNDYLQRTNARNGLQRGFSNLLQIFPPKTPSSTQQIRWGWCLYPTRHKRMTQKEHIENFARSKEGYNWLHFQKSDRISLLKMKNSETILWLLQQENTTHHCIIYIYPTIRITTGPFS